MKSTKTIKNPMYSDYIDMKKPMFLQKKSVLRFRKAEHFSQIVRFDAENDEKPSVL